MQVLAKSAKVIPVMLMGKLVSRAQYKNYEYATAVLISVGMTAFLLGSGEGKKGMQINRRFFKIDRLSQSVCVLELVR